MGAGLLLCAAWVALLRRQVARQTRTIAREIGQRTTNAVQALAQFRALTPDVTLMDGRLPDGSGVVSL